MDIFLWVLLSVLICSCTIFIIWAVRGALITPVKSTKGSKVYTVVAASGELAGLEQTVDGLMWLIRSGTLRCEVLIVDAGMSDEARTAAELMARDDSRIHLCKGKLCFTEDTWGTMDT